MTFKWGKLYHRSLQFFLSSGLGGGCDENRNNDAVIDGCCLSIYSASMHLEFISQNRLSLKKDKYRNFNKSS